MTSAPHPSVPRTPTTLAAALYLALFPLGHLPVVPVAGAMATAADGALVLFLAVWGAGLFADRGAARGLARVVGGEAVRGLPSRRVLVGLLLLMAFGAWVAASGAWGFHPRYAAVKGAGLAALALGAAALATSGLTWRRAVQAWLAGTAAALAATAVLVALGSAALRERVLYEGGGVAGLPFPRLAGPFLHPNMLGDYLVVSALLLWGLWPEVAGRRARGALAVLGAALAAALVLTASTAWVGAGVAAVGVGWLLAREGRKGVGATLGLAGVGVAGVTAVLLVVPLSVRVLGLDLATGAIRPAIWGSALRPFLERPLWGVGASPYVAEALDPLWGYVGLWDAHNAYLSVLGQFGLVGFALAAVGVWLVVDGALRARVPGRPRAALALALTAVAVNAVFLASEDLRHAWLLLGVAAMAGSEER